MRPQGPTFWQLDGRIGWRSASSNDPAQVSISRSALRLAADPHSPLSLSGGLSSLGGLTLPQGMALNQGSVLYLLDRKRAVIKRFDTETQAFIPLETVGGWGEGARQFRQPTSIACTGHMLYVVDKGSRRLHCFDQRSLSLVHLWQLDDWVPVDVTAHNGRAYVIDRRYGRVYQHQPGSDDLRLLVAAEPGASHNKRWTRLAVANSGDLYVLDKQAMHLVGFDAAGRPLPVHKQPEDVRDQFTAPAIMLDADGRFCLPHALTTACPAPETVVDPSMPLTNCPPWQQGGLLFDRRGRRVIIADPADVRPARLYVKKGTWISKPLDSQIHACQWHRIVFDMRPLPAGTQVHVSTYTATEPHSETHIANLPGTLWNDCFTLTGTDRAPLVENSAQSTPSADGLVQSQGGRYLWVRLRLTGDGYHTPTLQAVRVHYPRASYLAYLPAVFRDDAEGSWFLERFLAIFQTEFDQLEARIESISRYFDPQAVPEGAALAYLADWLALPLEGEWTEAQKRNMLTAVPEIYASRGTPASLRRYLQVYIENMTGLSAQEQGAYPRLLEGFRERSFLRLNQTSGLELNGAPLWGPQRVGRLQLDVFSREGEVRLVSTGDPERDFFHEFAHRFRVFVPAAWVRSTAAEQMIRRAIDSEKPAHTEVALHLVEPRLRVGLQSSIGLDTIVGDYPRTHLVCGDDDEQENGRSPHGRLGFDTILAASPPTHSGFSVGSLTRIGSGTALN